MQAHPPTRLRRRAAVLVPLVLLACQATAGVALAVTLPKSRPMDLHGTVRCRSGAEVQGVWVEGFSGGSWYADLTRDPDGLTRYSYRLPYGGKYQVHVGCGG